MFANEADMFANEATMFANEATMLPCLPPLFATMFATMLPMNPSCMYVVHVGRGIVPDVLHKLFKPFTQGKSSVAYSSL